MKRCPQCNRVETDDALVFCRADGTELVNDSSSLGSEAGTARLGLGSSATEAETNVLPHTTGAEISRDTAAATVLPAQPPLTSAELAKPKRRRNQIAIVAIVTAVVAATTAIVVDSYLSRKSHASIQSIAVMPFVNASGNVDVEYLSDGMTETLIRSLSQLPNLNVKARSSVFRYKGKETDAKTIGKELGVQALLNGRVVQRGEQLILNLELIDAQTENVIWADQYDRKSSDLVSLQNEIARDVSSRLKLKLTGADQQKLTRTSKVDPEAYRLYLQGRYYWNRRTGPEFEKAGGYFQQAVDQDPNFALGWVGLADFKEDQDRPRKKEYINRALQIDPDLAEAHASLGYQLMVDMNWAASERELKRAIELNPTYAQAYAWNGIRLTMIGKYNEALASLDRGLALEPTANSINFYKGVCLAVSGRRDEAFQQLKKLTEIDPNFSWAHRWLARLYEKRGDYAAVVEERAKAAELEGNPEDAKLMRESFAKGGWEGFRQSQRSKDPNTRLAEEVIDGAGKERVIQRLQQEAARGVFWLFLIRTEPVYDPLRSDRRFQEVLKKFEPPQ